MTRLQERLRDSARCQTARELEDYDRQGVLYADDYVTKAEDRVQWEAADALDAAEAEIARLKWGVNAVLGSFRASETAGYHTRDREFAISILEKAIEESAQPPAVGEVSVRINVAPRPDGGVRIWSDDLKGLVLSGSNRDLVFGDLGPAIKGLLRTKDAGHKPGNS